ncbi:MAG: HEAT repeat domain-containing protein [Planctomycetota bacterium]
MTRSAATVEPWGEALFELLRADMNHWPSPRARRAVERLVAGGPACLPAAREAIGADQPAMRVAAAQVLGRLGTWREWRAIRPLALDPRLGALLGDVLEALDRLDPHATRLLALDLLESAKSQGRAAVAAYLAARVSEGERERLRGLLEHREPAVRRTAFELLVRIGDGESVTDAIHLLGSRDSKLTEAAASYLTAQPAAEVLSALQGLLHGPSDQMFCHAVFVLSHFEDCGARGALPETLLPRLRPEVRSTDPLLRAAACVGTLTVTFRIGAVSTAEAFERDAVASLMELFIEARLFSGFWTAERAAARAVSRVTGWEIGERLPEWRRVWETEGSRFEVLHEVAGVSPIDMDAVRLLWQPSGDQRARYGSQVRIDGPRWLGWAPSEASSEGRSPGSCRVVLAAGPMERLLQELATEGFFDSERPRTLPPGCDGVVLRLRVPSGARDVACALPADERGQPLEAVVERALSDHRWQLYKPEDEDLTSFWERESPWWCEESDSRVRATRLVRRIVTALPLLDAFRARLALSHLEEALEAGGEFGPQRVSDLVTYALAAPHLDDNAARAVELATRCKDPLLFKPLAVGLRRSFGPAADGLVGMAMRALGQVATSLEDSDPHIRRLAVAETGTLGEVAGTLLAERLADPDREVRVAAIHSLGRLGAADAARWLAPLVHDAEASVRSAAVKMLAELATAETYGILVEAAEDPRDEVAAAALEGLSSAGVKEAEDVLIDRLMRDGPGTAVGAAAARALRRMGGARLRARLLEGLACPREELRREIVCLLGEHGADEAGPHLVLLLEAEPVAARARAALALLTQQDFDQETWKYAALVESGTRFVESFLAAAGLDGAIGPDELRGPEPLPDRAVPLLLAVLEDPRWYVRDAACVLLRDLTGKSGPDIPAAAGPADLAPLRGEWARAVSGAKTGREPAGEPPR